MAITQADLDQQIAVHAKVRKAFNRGKYRKSAKLLCDEFRRLLEKRTFWEGLHNSIPMIDQEKEAGQGLLANLIQLVELEYGVFSRLGIDDDDSRSVIHEVFGSLRRFGDPGSYDVSAANLRVLEENLRKATTMICNASKGPIQRARELILTVKGMRVLAGIITASANVIIFAIDGGALSWASVKAGIVVAQGNLKDIIDLLPDDDNQDS